MTTRAITLVTHQARGLRDGYLTALRRPVGHTLAKAKPGDLLWVREPFYLDGKYAALSPTAAAGLGAKPLFATEVEDLPGYARADLSKRHFARSMLRIWHRQHLIVRDVEHQHLQAITQAEIEAEGFVTRAAWAAAWDTGLSMSGAKRDAWRFDPIVTVLRFELVKRPLDQ